MIYEPSVLAVVVFFGFVGVTLGLSFWLGGKAKSSAGYFAAHGQIPWFVNGVAFAGDYLSAASFLGICGMIAFYGYDGFLYSIGYLAGWIVALFIVAEPMKRLGKFTFADALNTRFDSPGIQVVAGISTLVVSIFYLIPQMVGAGALVTPLLGFDHWVGVVIVGATVILIVVTAGMVSTTWVQFLKGSLLVFFSAILTIMLLYRGFTVDDGGKDGHAFRTWGPFEQSQLVDNSTLNQNGSWTIVEQSPAWKETDFLRIKEDASGAITVWHRVEKEEGLYLVEAQSIADAADGRTLINGLPKGKGEGEAVLHPVGYLSELPDGEKSTEGVGPLEFFSTLQKSKVILWPKQIVRDGDEVTTVYYQKETDGSQVLRPGEHPRFKGIRSDNLIDKLNFLSLMLALFCGTASLPHILIRYYTVKDEVAARKSTIVGIASIGFFYVLSLYIGLGAMTSGALDVTNSNMAAPLLARSIAEWLFAAISAIAFTTVLGTVSGLILASAGAVTHDLVGRFVSTPLTDSAQVRLAKLSSVGVGIIAIVLGIVFEKMNVSYLVGWAFSVAASANLPSLVMLLFWKRTTKEGVITALMVGMISSLGWILLSEDTYTQVYGLSAQEALVPFSQPGIVTIPLGFLTLILVSLITQPKANVEK
ncbi:sodium/solute symporter [Rubinisphaera italica]|uniref:Cation/acetate symporter ActP n=1 Tax=Rubinisphaera italica TaxID=2527969 RepID=A0A5C5XDU5_9PLAN|nr:cation acetate symporter [Rubinisphaera italica]TWT61180.1 Cation/acetate symporter ActP [Rubinisphaera italica]